MAKYFCLAWIRCCKESLQRIEKFSNCTKLVIFTKTGFNDWFNKFFQQLTHDEDL